MYFIGKDNWDSKLMEVRVQVLQISPN